MGAQVMLTQNLWPTRGLMNGTMGRVVDIIYLNGRAPPQVPDYVIVECPQATVPGFNGKPHHVAIEPQTVPIDGRKDTRRQIPLRLAWAITIHKSQGMTIKQGQVLTKSVIDLGDREFQSGLSFAP